MCGIVGYSGKRSAQEVLLNGLEKLEYGSCSVRHFCLPVIRQKM